MAGYVPDLGGFEQRRRNIDDQYTQTAAKNAYTRFLSQQRGQRGMSDMTQGFQRAFPSFQAANAQRGLSGPGVRSGVMQNSLRRYVGDYQQNYARAGQDLTQQMQGFDLDSAMLDSWKSRSLADLEAEKQKEIALAAMNLEALRPYLGGL